MWPGWSLLGDDCICWASRLQDLWNPGSLIWVGGPPLCQWCVEAFAKGSAVFPPCIPFWIPQGHGLKRGSPPRCPSPLCQVNFCHWCGKEGQNEGTVVNHLWTMHYKLGIDCSRYLHFPLITLEAIWYHGQGCKQPRESDAKEEDGGDNVATFD